MNATNNNKPEFKSLNIKVQRPWLLMLQRAAGCRGGAEKQALCLSHAKAAQQQMLSRPSGLGNSRPPHVQGQAKMVERLWYASNGQGEKTAYVMNWGDGLKGSRIRPRKWRRWLFFSFCFLVIPAIVLCVSFFTASMNLLYPPSLCTQTSFKTNQEQELK